MLELASVKVRNHVTVDLGAGCKRLPGKFPHSRRAERWAINGAADEFCTKAMLHHRKPSAPGL